MNFTKFKYEAQHRAKESRKKATNITVKEMKYRPKIGGGDFDTKTRKVAQFLGEGHKVKVTIMFRGREMQHPELGRRILDRVAGEVEHLGRVEIMPKQDGRNMTMVLGPDKKAQAAHAKKIQAETTETDDAAVDAVPVEQSVDGDVVTDVEVDAVEVDETEAFGQDGSEAPAEIEAEVVTDGAG